MYSILVVIITVSTLINPFQGLKLKDKITESPDGEDLKFQRLLIPFRD